jgi:hypothetical protein
MSDFSGLPPEYKPLLDEAMRLAGTVQDLVRRAVSESGHAAEGGQPAEGGQAAQGEQTPHATDCAWCPLCQFVAVVRGDRPEVTERVADAGTVFLSAVRAVLEAAGTATSHAASAAGQARTGAAEDPAGKPAPRVQKINLGDAS